MKARVQAASTFLLIALVLSFIPAAALPTNASAAPACDWAQFVADVTVPDGSIFDPGQAFTKTWRLRNIGTCTWTTAYTMVFDSGTQMGSTTSVPFTTSVAPGGTIDLSVPMTAPSSAGHYIGYWKFKNASGALFGIGFNSSKSWWVEINVRGTPTTNVAYDFTANAGSATWSSGAGGLSFPGTDGDAKGFALKLDKPNFESGVVASQPGLLVSPQQITNGFIQARYPDFTVQSGDRFQATVGCQAGATSCYVAYRLDYEVNGTIRTFWTFREKFEGLTYNANLNLSPLAGQTVKFILYVSAWGSPIGDRALWGNPVIARQGVVITPTGTPPTPTPTQTPGPVTVPPSACDRAQFIADVNIPDGTVLAPGATFTKTWRLKNVGSCAWSTSYQLVFFSGAQMGAASSAAFPQNVSVGQTVDVSINMTAPSAAGSYRGYWMFKNASGALFGIGAQANKPWWVDIKVSGSPVTPGGPTVTPGGPTVTPAPNIAYDFATNACAATWFSGAGQLPCPGTDGDAKGFVLKVSNPKLETGATDTRPGLITFPQNIQNGYIQGFFPPFKVQSGDRFRSIINCEAGATSCYVAFRLDYQTGTDPIKTFFGPFLERYEGQYYSVDVDLSSLAGKDVKFILTVLAAGTATGDRALWVGPIIYRTGASPANPAATTAVPTTPTTPVATTAVPTTAVATTPATPAAAAYQNAKYNFKFTLPSGASIVSQTDNVGRVNLPIVTGGTNLLEKYIQVNVEENKSPCTISPAVDGPATSTENVTINNFQFVKTTGQGVAAGNRYDWTSYATTSNNACISLAFILHSANPGNYSTPPPEFDPAKESAVIGTTISTFSKMNP
jgi:Ig-like domain from next to BRCA1 gene